MTFLSFAHCLNISFNLNLTSFIDDICEKFQIRKEWLEHGDGNPERPLDRQDEIAKLTADLFKGEKNSFKERLIFALANLDESEWELLEKIAEKIAKEKD